MKKFTLSFFCAALWCASVTAQEADPFDAALECYRSSFVELSKAEHPYSLISDVIAARCLEPFGQAVYPDCDLAMGLADEAFCGSSQLITTVTHATRHSFHQVVMGMVVDEVLFGNSIE